MSANQHDEYAANIDDQLLQAAKQDALNLQRSRLSHQGHRSHRQHSESDVDSDPSHIKLEEIASAAAIAAAKDNDSNPDKYLLQDAALDHLSRLSRHAQDSGERSQQHQLLNKRSLSDLQPQQQHQQQQQQQQQHYQHLQGLPYDDEYNIQIPDPVIDAKLKIYPVSENTITAEGYLITRPYPDQLFQLREDLNDFIQEFARDNGFGVVIAHSNKKAIYYTCELGGHYRHKKLKSDPNAPDDDLNEDTMDIGEGYMLDPNAKTKKLKCPFSMTASYKKSNGMWTLKITCNEHNHPQLDPLSNHPMLRKRSDELNLLILDLYKLGTKPSHIESKIKELYPGVLIKREDIYNEIRGYKRKLKKQNSRYAFGGGSSRYQQYKKRTMGAGVMGPDGVQIQDNQSPSQLGAHLNSHLTAHLGHLKNELGDHIRRPDDANDAAAAVVAAQAAAAQAATNAFLNSNDDDDEHDHDGEHHGNPRRHSHMHLPSQDSSGLLYDLRQDPVLRQHQREHRAMLASLLQHQHQDHDFQQQFREVAEAARQHQLDGQQYLYAHMQGHNLQDDDSAAAAVIAAVANHHGHTSDSGELTMENIDSRLVGE